VSTRITLSRLLTGSVLGDDSEEHLRILLRERGKGLDVVPEVGQQPVDRGETIRCLLLYEVPVVSLPTVLFHSPRVI